METPSSIFETLFEKIQALGLTTYELSKLKALYTISNVTTSVVSRVIVFLVITMFALLFSIGLALFLGEVLGKHYYGFLIVAAFYLLAGIILHFYLHRWIKKPLSDMIVYQALK